MWQEFPKLDLVRYCWLLHSDAFKLNSRPRMEERFRFQCEAPDFSTWGFPLSKRPWSLPMFLRQGVVTFFLGITKGVLWFGMLPLDTLLSHRIIPTLVSLHADGCCQGGVRPAQGFPTPRHSVMHGLSGYPWPRVSPPAFLLKKGKAHGSAPPDHSALQRVHPLPRRTHA